MIRFLGAVAGLALLVAAADPFVTESVRVPMRDGVRLSANVFRPVGSGRLPVILVRTPYGKGKELSRSYRMFVDNGYAVVVQDVRGKYDSEGVFDPLRQETPDGEDTLNWVVRQAWSNGSVGMVGGSYVGIVQWKAALAQHPALKAIFPVVSGWDDYTDRFYSTGGAMKAGNRLLWMANNMKAPGYRVPDFHAFVRATPLKDADRAATGQQVPMFQTVMEHPAYDGFWRSISVKDKIAQVKVPVFSVGGWYDNFVQSDLEAFTALRKLGRHAHTLIGPWPHNMSVPFAGVDFGPDSSAPVGTYQLEWNNRLVKGESAKDRFAPLRIFVMGANKWRDEQEWPLARAVATPYYFASRTGANGLEGDGQLRVTMRQREHADHFVYDPRNPVPTRGGNTCCDPKVFEWGPVDQTAVEQRKDVLVYTSAPLAKDLEVTGPIKAVLYVSTSAPDTDFSVKLVDVHPDGRAINLTDGLLRMRYRDGLDRVALVDAGRVYQVTVDAGVTSNVFRAGHSVRVEVSSSNFPRFDRNWNTGRPVSYEARGQAAEQTVYLGGSRASHIVLPVVP